MTHRLIRDFFYKHFGNPLLNQDHDGCVFEVEKGRLAFSTDSFVVDPIFFPGGNIGDLAVNGTVNDLACCGAKPLYLSVGFMLEEGLPFADLEKIVISMKNAAKKAGVSIITGDTKVVERGKCDKIFINTSGIGVVPDGIHIHPKNAKTGDVVICSGPIGAHGIAILSARDGLNLETTLESDTASLNNMIETLLREVKDIHVIRDATRGGISSALNEIAASSQVGITLDETVIAVPEQVNAASELLGLDPLYIANEGVVVIIAAKKCAAQIIDILHQFEEGKQATVIGEVHSAEHPVVKMRTLYGGERIIQMLSGDQLPRIC